MCKLCEPSHYLANQICWPCPDKCETCSNSITCLTCQERYFRDKDGVCSLCPSGCLMCVLSPLTDTPSCLQCDFGYYKTYAADSIVQSCQLCNVSNCELCQPSGSSQSNNTCSFCAINATLVDGVCLSCPTNCYNCLNNTATNQVECQTCFLGYGLVNGTCTQCVAGCDICNDNVCTFCTSGFYLGANNTCLPCQSIA